MVARCRRSRRGLDQAALNESEYAPFGKHCCRYQQHDRTKATVIAMITATA